MKPPLYSLFGLLIALSVPLTAQQEVESADSATTSVPAPRFSAEQLEKLLGPIALYPDALIALILPASTTPSDVVLAARFLGQSNDLAQVDAQAWDDSVKALVHYPEVVRWMDQNLAWTTQLGQAFLGQSSEVMNAVQRLRTQAKAAGNLVSTPQQQVVYEDQNISIVPAQPDVIYVPYYDPAVVYVSRPGYYYDDSFLSFGVGYATGFWLGYDLDWRRRCVWSVDARYRDRYWRDRRDWRHPVFPGGPGYVRDPGRHPWHPVTDYRRPSSRPGGHQVVARPDSAPTAPDRVQGDSRRPGGYASNRDRNSSAARDDRGSQPVRQREAGLIPRTDRPRIQTPIPVQASISTPTPSPSQPSREAVARSSNTPSQAPVGRGGRYSLERLDNPDGYTRGANPPSRPTAPPAPTASPAREYRSAPAASQPRQSRSAPAPASSQARESRSTPERQSAPQRDSAPSRDNNNDRSKQSRR